MQDVGTAQQARKDQLFLSRVLCIVRVTVLSCIGFRLECCGRAGSQVAGTGAGTRSRMAPDMVS